MFHSEVYRPNLLTDYVENFQFISKSNLQEVSFSTFQNINYCLTIFKKSKIIFDNKSHLLTVKNGQNSFSSFFDGFHKSPIHLKLNGEIDQICIIFKPEAINFFSNINSIELSKSTDAFFHLFGLNSQYFLEYLFDNQSNIKRVVLLETFLISKLNTIRKPITFSNILQIIDQKKGIIQLNEIEKKYNLNRIDLYRKFYKYLGLSPKNYIETVRFRETIRQFKYGKFDSFTDLAYLLGYTDQAHFINSFQKLSGTTPTKFYKEMKITHDTFVWTNNL